MSEPGSARAPGAEAVARCRAVMARHSRSFALASGLLPPRLRDRAAVVYTWCRYADDAVDRAPRAEQPARLARLGAELDEVYAGRPPRDGALAAFQHVVRACAIPRAYPAELLAGMDMDVRGTRYDTLETLLRYCFRVAGTVGLMMSHVMGVSREGALENAVHLGMAMQLTNICRDVVEDWHMGRLYVPADILAGCGLADLRADLGRPFPPRARAPMARAVRALLSEADRFYRSGDQGLSALPWQCALAVRAARLMYASIGDRIAAVGHDVTAGRAVVPAHHKLALVGRAGILAVAELSRQLPERVAPRLAATLPPYRVPKRIIRFPEHVLPL